MKIERVCQLHENFQCEWKRDFPVGPLPVLDFLDDVIKKGHKTTNEDETSLSVLVSSLQERVIYVNKNIDLIREQLHRELVVKQFLIRVLDIIDPSIDFSAQLTTIYDHISFLNNWKSNRSSSKYNDKSLEAKLNYFESFKLNSTSGNKKAADRSNTLPKLCYSSQNKGRPKGIDDKDKDIDNNLVDSSKNDEMFNRKKKNVTKANDGDSRNGVLGSKDNFLAVKSKNIAPNIATNNNEGNQAGPNLSRHFQMLKLTDGFDLVLGDSAGDDKKHEGQPKHGGNFNKPDLLRNHNEFQSCTNESDRNRKDDSLKISQETGCNEINVTTIKIQRAKVHNYGDEAGSKDERLEVTSTKQTSQQGSSTLLVRRQIHNNDDQSLQQQYSQDILHKLDGHLEHSDSFQDKLRKFSIKGSAVPPPVAKKPARSGSGGKPSPSSIPTCVDSSVSGSNGVPSSQSYTQINNDNYRVLNRSKSDGESSSSDNITVIELNAVQLTSPTQEIVIDQTTERRLTDNEIITDQITSHSNDISSESEIKETTLDITEEIQETSEMNFNMLKKSGSHRGSVENLVQGIGYSMINSQRTVDDVSKTLINVSLPKVPCRKPISSCIETVLDTYKTDDAVECRVLVSSDSKEAEDVVFDSEPGLAYDGSNKRGKSRQSDKPHVADIFPASHKRISSTPNYENWTINWAITDNIPVVDCLSVSDDDELDKAPLSPVSASPSFDHQDISNRSHDSGLYEDINSSKLSPNDLDFVTTRTLQEPKVISHSNRRILYVDEQTLPEFVCVETDFNNEAVRARATEVGRKEEDVTERLSAPSDEEVSPMMDTSFDVTDSATDGMLKMRQLLVKGVLDSEKSYLGILSLLIDYKRSLEASSMSSQPVISKEDIQTIFSNIETVNEIHTEFVESLGDKVNNWTHGESVGDIFKIMISKMINFGNYLNNYHQAVSTIHRCCQESEQFDQLAKHIHVNSTVKEITSLEDALFKPVQRVQRNTLVLHDLIKYTPESHPDYHSLQKALKLSHQIIENFATLIPQSHNTQDNRRLVKSSFLVEDVGGTRKLRYIFLFSDVLVCTKRELRRNNKVTFDIKWFAPLTQSSIDTKFSYDDAKTSTKDDIGELKTKLKGLKREFKQEVGKSDDKDKHRVLGSLGGGPARNVEKLQKKINQIEAQLILSSPKLPFKVLIDGGRSYTLLMSTDYEREEWKETISALFKKVSRGDHSPNTMSSIFIQELINNVKETPQVNKIGNVLLKKDQDMLTGILNVTIHKVNGLSEICDTYCNLEMDSFGHFFFKARTTICERTQDPAWNEDFDLELEGSETLRILCFKKQSGGQGDKLLGRGALELNQQWLKGSFQEKTLSMNEISLVISMRHIPADKTMQRTPSRTSSAVFGVIISSCAKREGKTVPMIVTACVQEVEKRGMDEVGIYRVSGVSSDLQYIKKLIDKNSKAGTMLLQDADIHSVTGVLKLYLRELPEPLFTEANYHSFVDTLKLCDDEAKTQCMLSLLHGLPDTNYYTIVYLLEHLIKVAKQVGVNKMSIHNLSTIFGPTLLAPATKQTSTDPLEMMFKGAEEVMHQSSVVNFFLGLAFSGRSLRRSAQ